MASFHLQRFWFSDQFNQDNDYSILGITYNRHDLLCLNTRHNGTNGRWVRVYRQIDNSETQWQPVFTIDMTEQRKLTYMHTCDCWHVCTVDNNPNIYHLIASHEPSTLCGTINIAAGFTVFVNNGNPVILDTFTALNSADRPISHISSIGSYLYGIGKKGTALNSADRPISHISSIGSYLYGIGKKGTTHYVIKANVPHRNPGGQKLKPRDKPLKWSPVFTRETDTQRPLYSVNYEGVKLHFTFKHDFQMKSYIEKYCLNTDDDTFTHSSYTYEYDAGYYRKYAIQYDYAGHFMFCDNHVINGHAIGNTPEAHNTWVDHHDFVHTADNPCWVVPELHWIKPDGSSHIITLLSTVSVPYVDNFKFVTNNLFSITWTNESGTQVRILYYFDADALNAIPVMVISPDTCIDSYNNYCLIDDNRNIMRLAQVNQCDIHDLIAEYFTPDICDIIDTYYRPALPCII
jgi:hypothetical protein